MCECLARKPAAEVLLLDIGGVVAIEHHVELLLVGAVATAVQGEVLLETRQRLAVDLAVELDVAQHAVRLLLGEGGDAVEGAGLLAGLVDQELVGLEEVLLE